LVLGLGILASRPRFWTSHRLAAFAATFLFAQVGQVSSLPVKIPGRLEAYPT